MIDVRCTMNLKHFIVRRTSIIVHHQSSIIIHRSSFITMVVWEKIKAFGMEVWYFFSSRVFWKNFGKMAGIIALLLFMLFWMMTCFTRHGDKERVGNYVGKNMKEVENLIDNDGFDYVVSDSIYREDFPADIVLEQNPLPNSMVKTGRTIYLKITTARGSLRSLPDLAGSDQIDFYIEAIRDRKMKVGKIDTLPDPNLGDGTIKQVLWKGRDITKELGKFQIPEGSVLDFVISRRENNNRDVPPFMVGGTYQTLEDYIAQLGLNNLNVREIVKDPSVTDENSAFVIKVSPRVNVELQKGDSVTIFITQKNPAATRTDSFDQ
jgi:eukaryotic-like serine/threonine-protein kinase